MIPTLSHTTDTVIYLFYGNANITTSQEHKAGVWQNNYLGVWHLPNGSTLSANDSTGNGGNGTLENSPSATTGLIDGAAGFNGNNQYIAVNEQYGLTTALTFSAWVEFSNLSGWQDIFGQDTSSWSGGDAAFYFQKSTDSNPSCSRPANGLGILLPMNSSDCALECIPRRRLRPGHLEPLPEAIVLFRFMFE
jgi:hypothetical protein